MKHEHFHETDRLGREKHSDRQCHSVIDLQIKQNNTTVQLFFIYCNRTVVAQQIPNV